jgi:subtilisin-like proprotein convertase family protein
MKMHGVRAKISGRSTTRGGGAARVEPLERRALLTASISGVAYQDENFNGVYDVEGPDFGRGLVRVYHDANDNGQFDSGIVDRFASGSEVPVDIPAGGGVTSRIVVSDLPGNVRDLNVSLDIQHPSTPDLEATLISPTGRTVLLFSGVGDNPFGSQDFQGTTLDDEATLRIQDGEAPFTARYRPMQPLNRVDGEPANGTWTLRVEDLAGNFDGTLLDWHLSFDTGAGEPSTTTAFDGSYTLANLAPGTYRVRQVLDQGLTQTQPAGGGPHVVTLVDGQNETGRNFGAATGVPAATVVGRHVFYNRSVFDGGDAGASGSDNNAIATDKQALLPGQSATFANVTSYGRGINGVMVDVSNLPDAAEPSAADFSFKSGTDPDPSTWSDVAVQPAVTVRRGDGVNGAARVTLIWPDGTTVGRWLGVTVKNTPVTGLATPDVFYFGNLPGDTGNAAAEAAVTVADVLAVRSALNQSGRPVTDPNDFTRDGRVNASDFAIVRGWMGRSLTVFAPSVASPAEGVAVATVPSRRLAHRPPRVWDEAPASVL